jgi:hypothetical protein
MYRALFSLGERAENIAQKKKDVRFFYLLSVWLHLIAAIINPSGKMVLSET